MPKAAVYSPAVINNGRVPSNGQGRGKNNLASRGGEDLQPLAAAKIEARMKSGKLSICVDDLVDTAGSIPRGKAIRVNGRGGKYTVPKTRRGGWRCDRENVFHLWLSHCWIDRAGI